MNYHETPWPLHCYIYDELIALVFSEADVGGYWGIYLLNGFWLWAVNKILAAQGFHIMIWNYYNYQITILILSNCSICSLKLTYCIVILVGPNEGVMGFVFLLDFFKISG